MPHRANPLQLALFVSYAAVWGSTYVWTSMALEAFSPGALVFARLAIGSLLLFCVASDVRAAVAAARRRPRETVTLGVVAYGGPFLVMAVAQQHISAGLTGVLVATMPLWTAAIAPLVERGSRVGRMQAAGLLTGWVGVALIVGGSAVSTATEIAAAAAVLLSAASLAWGGFRVTRDLAELSVTSRAAVALAVAAVVTAPIGAADLLRSCAAVPPARAIVALLVVAVFSTAIGAIMQVVLTVQVGAGRAALAAYLAPGFSLVFAAVMVHEPLTVTAVGGLGVIVAGVALAGRGSEPQVPPPLVRATKTPTALGASADCRASGGPAESAARGGAIWPLPPNPNRSSPVSIRTSLNQDGRHRGSSGRRDDDAFPVGALRKLLPGGHGRSTFGVGPVIPYAVRGEGYLLEIDDGRRIIDLNNNFTALVHGHAHPAIVDAAVQAVADGASYGLPNFNELRHASALLSRTSHLDQVRYTNSGTEAVMTAVRVARAHTRRDGCIFVNATYHGTADSALAPGGPLTRRGVPRGVLDDVVVLPINDVDALVAAVEKHPRRFAAMVLDLLPNRAGLVPLTPEYVEAAEHMRAQHGVLLVIDEVISFRQDWRGLAGQYGMTPDLMTLGKLIGGGHPIGAVLGREAVMSELDPLRPDGLEHGGTFTGNPVTMAAGLAAMELFDVDAVSRLNGLGRRIRDGLRVVVEDLGWEVRGSGSLFRLHPGPTATEPVPVLQRALWWEALRREVLTAPNGLASLSTPMDEAVVDEVVGRLADALRAVVDASGARAAGTVA